MTRQAFPEHTNQWDEHDPEVLVPATGDPPLEAVAPEHSIDTLPQGPIGRQVFLLALPMLGEQFVNFLVGTVDIFLAGQVSKEATGAVGTGAYMGWFATLAYTLIATGAAAVVARSFGARDRATADRAMNQSFVLAIVLGVAVGAVVFTAAPLLGAFLGQTAEASALFTRYVRIDAFGLVLFSIVLICGGVIRAAGDTRTPMIVMIIVNLVNIVVSAALVFGWLGLPQLGVTGIAIGTVVARSLGGILIALVLVRGLRGMYLRFRRLTPDREVIWRMLRIGVPAAGDAGLMWMAQMAFIKIVSHTATGEQATANYAAHMIAMRLEAITYLPAVAWMTASGTLVGQYLGARQPDQATRAGWTAALQGALLATGVGICFFVFAQQLYEFMSDDPAVVAVGTPAFRLMALVQPFLCAAIIFIGSLRGAGDTRTTMVFSLIGGILLRVPVAYLFGIVLGGGLIGAWIGMWCDNLAKFVMGAGRFLHGGWKRVTV